MLDRRASYSAPNAKILQQRVTQLLEHSTQRRTTLRDKQLRNTLSELRSSGNAIYIFGGLLRDLLAELTPRDVDLVVSDRVVHDLEDRLNRWKPRRNRFGGMNFKNDGWDFDLWPLEKTWAFNHKPEREFETSFDCLPRTTFLNVEAIAMELWPSGSPRKIFEHGFFSAFRSRTVEINYEPNPAPEYCIIRSLLVAQRLHFQLGPRLVGYIAQHATKFTMQEYAKLQGRHYGKSVITVDNMNRWLDVIHRHADDKKQSALSLPIPCSRQLDLFSNHQLSFWSSSNNDDCYYGI